MEGKEAITSVTLLGRLRDPADGAAWREFDSRYRDLIGWFLRRRGLQLADAEDVTQQVIAKLVSGLRSFEYDRAKGGFRVYLYRCIRNAMIDFRSRQNGGGRVVFMNGGADFEGPDPEAAAFEREWADHHYRLAVKRFRAESNERVHAILDGTIAGTPARAIAERLGTTESAVYKAQQRLRDRLGELIAEQVADEELERERGPG